MYVRVKVTPESRKETLQKVSDTEFNVSVKEPATQNLANRRLRELMALEYGISKGNVRIVTGHRSRTKILDITIT